jgi:rubrerythrin
MGEYAAQRKYEIFSKKAFDEQIPMIAKLFKVISKAEEIHIKNHIQVLKKITSKPYTLEEIVGSKGSSLVIGPKSTRDNLMDAIRGESYEFKKMYKNFIKTAKKKEIFLAEFSFNLARKAEKVHSELFNKYLKFLDKGKNLEERPIFLCTICGNVELDQAPLICPNCDHDQQFFDQIKL